MRAIPLQSFGGRLMHAERFLVALALKVVASAACALALCATASAQDAPRARLLTVPDVQALTDVFPVVALARGVSGRVVLSCDVAADGSSDCAAAEETPTAMGFGAAAEALAADWRFTPVAGAVRIPIEFRNEITEPLTLERGITIESFAGIDLRPQANDNYNQLMATYHAITVCLWSGRPDCADTEGPENVRVLYNVGHYPLDAAMQGVSGRAVVACAVRSSGEPECALEAVNPNPYGFGDNALRIVSDIAEAQRGQLAPGQAVRVPVSFSIVDRSGQRQTPWIEMPEMRDYVRYYPRDAMRRDIEGSTSLICTILPDRRLDCVVAEEDPAGHGFGAAALSISERFRLSEEAVMLPGYTVGERIRQGIVFRLG